jgi:hypothetical protein
MNSMREVSGMIPARQVERVVPNALGWAGAGTSAFGTTRATLCVVCSVRAGRVVPARPKVEVPVDDPVFRLAGLAAPMGALTNEQIGRLVQGG